MFIRITMSSTEFSLSIKREELSYHHILTKHPHHVMNEPFGFLHPIYRSKINMNYMKRDLEEVTIFPSNV